MMDDKINDKIRLIFKIIILLFIYYYFIIYLLLFYLCKINSVKQNIILGPKEYLSTLILGLDLGPYTVDRDQNS